MFKVNKKITKKALNPNWGGYREKSGRKSTWNHKETSTIRIPKALEQEVMRYARYLDAGFELDHEINSSSETINALNTTDQLERVTESGFEGYPMRSFMDAIFLAREIVQQKKCARISLAKFISRFYLTPVNSDSLKSYP